MHIVPRSMFWAVRAPAGSTVRAGVYSSWADALAHGAQAVREAATRTFRDLREAEAWVFGLPSAPRTPPLEDDEGGAAHAAGSVTEVQQVAEAEVARAEQELEDALALEEEVHAERRLEEEANLAEIVAEAEAEAMEPPRKRHRPAREGSPSSGSRHPTGLQLQGRSAGATAASGTSMSPVDCDADGPESLCVAPGPHPVAPRPPAADDPPNRLPPRLDGDQQRAFDAALSGGNIFLTGSVTEVQQVAEAEVAHAEQELEDALALEEEMHAERRLEEEANLAEIVAEAEAEAMEPPQKRPRPAREGSPLSGSRHPTGLQLQGRSAGATAASGTSMSPVDCDADGPESLCVAPGPHPVAPRPPAADDPPNRLPPRLDGDQQRAFDAALSGGNIFLTGGPGTGKSFTLRQIIAALHAKFGPDGVLVAAPTGVAALIAEGQTLHSSPGPGIPKGTTEAFGNMHSKTSFHIWRKVDLCVGVVGEHCSNHQMQRTPERAMSKHLPPSLYKVPTYSTRVGAAPRAPGGARHGGGNKAVTSQLRKGHRRTEM